MKEKDFLSIIKQVTNSSFIGDDCAYLKDLGIVVTQDNLVEGVHFSLEYMTPYQLGYKSVMVNLSDIVASGAEAKYITIALSLPENITDKFIEEFYIGAQKACGSEVVIAGGDITGGDKVFVSICAIGSTMNRKIASRKNAKPGYKIVISGNHGSSAAGLKLLSERKTEPKKFIKAHLEPFAQIEFGKKIAQYVENDYAMMDTSDGLMDALWTIANESGVLLELDFNKIPYDKDIEKFDNWKDLILYGGEDYGIVAVVPQDCNIPDDFVVGYAKSGLGVDLLTDNNIVHISKNDIENKIFNHFDTENK